MGRPSLQHRDLGTGPDQQVRRGQAGSPRSHHDHRETGALILRHRAGLVRVAETARRQGPGETEDTAEPQELTPIEG